jgi:hypothetical protein
MNVNAPIDQTLFICIRELIQYLGLRIKRSVCIQTVTGRESEQKCEKRRLSVFECARMRATIDFLFRLAPSHCCKRSQQNRSAARALLIHLMHFNLVDRKWLAATFLFSALSLSL